MQTFRIGLLLGFRQIQRANTWTTILIIFVMMLTFLNLIAVSGILVGLIAGSERAVQDKSIGDLIITPLDDEEKILQTETIRRVLDTTPEVSSYSIRYTESVQVTANYKTRRDFGIEPNTIGARALGIDPVAENAVTALAENVIEGEYLNPDESGYILIGALNIDRYTAGFADITGALEDVYPGDSVRVTVNGMSREFTVKGIINSKAGDVASFVYISEKELRRLSNTASRDADGIIVRLADKTPETGAVMKSILVQQNIDSLAEIRTFQEALPKFITDIKQTFNILGTFIGAVGIIVASITIFIIIFINAISRRQQIGILKGIGIDRKAIEVAYVLQSAFYALVGSLLGILVTYGFLVGYFDANPIDFPFSDGILVAEPLGTFYRFVILFIITLFAGFIPAWIIVRQNTLNSILGRK